MPGRRPFVALVALFVVPLPACLHISAPAPPPEDPKDTRQTTKTEPVPPRLEFASLPRIPGSLILTRTATNNSAAPNSGQQANNQQKPSNPPPGPTPTGPVSPIGGGGGEPNLFPPVNPALEPPLLAAVRAYVENRPDRAIELLRGLDRPNQDLVLALLPVLARGGSADLNNDAATTAALVDQLRSLAARLEPHAALRIEKAAFCNEVSGFGRFDPRPAGNPYRPNERIQFYLEVRNLTSEPAGDGYLTHVHAAVEVRDAKEQLVDQIDTVDYKRRVPVVRFEKQLPSRSPLHDFHVLYVFSAPPTPGVYTITIELRDPSGRRVVKTAPAEFRVAGP
jgi:hypothetical protein